MSVSDSAIETIGLTKRFESRKQAKTLRQRFFGGSQIISAVDHVDLKVNKGELFGLLGPNGAGKTTFIKILCTLLIPDEGEAYVNGFNVMKEDMEVRKSLGTLFSFGGRGFHYRLTG